MEFVFYIILLLLLNGPDIARKVNDVGIGIKRKLAELRTALNKKTEELVTAIPGFKLVMTILTLSLKLAFHLGLLDQRICTFLWPAFVYVVSANSTVCRTLAVLGASLVSF